MIVEFTQALLTTPQQGNCNTYIDYYWILNSKGDFVKHAGYLWSCNKDKHYVEKRCKEDYPNCIVKQFPVVYLYSHIDFKI